MNRAELTEWLRTYTPFELEFRRLYRKYHSDIPDAEIKHVLDKYNSGPDSMESMDFRNIDAAVPLDQPLLPETLVDATWLGESDYVSVRKHPRYFPENRHSHNFVELAYVLEGKCSQTFFMDGYDEPERIEMNEGELCIITPGIDHSISVFDDSIIINILIRTNTLKRTLNSLVSGEHALFEFFNNTLYSDSVQNFMVFDAHDSESIRDLIQAIMIELCEEKAYCQKTVLLMLGLLFTYLQRDCSDKISFSKHASAGIGYVPQIMSYIHYNYKDASVESISEHFHLSRPYLSRLFKEHTNKTIIQMLQQIRMERAGELLRQTQLPVQIIAERVGYSDVTFFIRVFRKVNGCTPLQYRKNSQTVL
ncbi:MAG: helix-turn-helix domain-containing protein [Mogibacterium sp.]|nr:helix-turn-helix domain-containing protein [Mogibacterium sp.]MBQ6502268.1 helix-turn-helix domain-containing protein [Mogibacterium sp.]